MLHLAQDLPAACGLQVPDSFSQANLVGIDDHMGLGRGALGDPIRWREDDVGGEQLVLLDQSLDDGLLQSFGELIVQHELVVVKIPQDDVEFDLPRAHGAPHDGEVCGDLHGRAVVIREVAHPTHAVPLEVRAPGVVRAAALALEDASDQEGRGLVLDAVHGPVGEAALEARGLLQHDRDRVHVGASARLAAGRPGDEEEPRRLGRGHGARDVAVALRQPVGVVSAAVGHQAPMLAGRNVRLDGHVRAIHICGLPGHVTLGAGHGRLERGHGNA
mmetsp:Transcript_107382/g.313984  ORF Transcript_107382/g.313984 Transcript_107382/m.313984 type:complete len:274 (+) Transcript_107382:537-1358(+)